MSRGGILKKRYTANGAQVRLNKDLQELADSKDGEIYFPDPENIQKFNVRIKPISGIWRGANFDFSFEIPNNWPYDRPVIKMITRIWHPNISEDGNVCLNILRDNYSPCQTISNLVQGLYFLFNEPNPNSPLNIEAANQYLQDLNAFKQKAEEYIKLYCPK